MADRTLRSYLEENAPELVELLAPIRAAVAELWDRPQHQEFTDHGLGHSERVIAKLDALSHDMMGTGRKLCPREAFYALAAAYLHDVGMQMAKPQQSNVLLEACGADALGEMDRDEYKRVVRDHHALLSAEMIIAGAKAPTEHYDLKVPRQDAAYLASIVKGHGLDDLAGEEFSDMYVGDDVIRVRLLAAMLRLADELDVDSRRVNIDLLKVQEIETLSKLHWWKHHYVEGAHIERGTILLHFRLPSAEYADPVQKYVIDRIKREERELQDILWDNDVQLRLKPPQVTYDPLREEMPPDVWDLLIEEVGGPPPEEKRPATVEDYLQRLSDDDDFRYASLALPGMEKRIDLESLYVPLAVMERMELERLQEETRTKTFERMRQMSRDGESEPVDIDQALSAHRRIVVLGHPGAGKTTLLKHFVITFARGRRAERWAPIYVSLASMARSGQTIDEYIGEACRRYNLGPDFYAQLQARAADGTCIFLFDGLDEVGAEKYSQIRDEVSKFLAAHKSCPAVVTCRVMSYRNPLPFPSFVVMDISPEQAQELADNWFADDEPKRQKLREALDHNERLRELAANPFLLTILAIIVEKGRELPKRRAELYGACTAILLELWDEARDTPRQNVFLRLHKERALEEVALHFTERGERVFSASDLTQELSRVLRDIEPGLSVAPFLKEIVENSGILRQLSEDEYDFLHLTFHEYYAARCLKRHPERDEVVKRHGGEDHWREVALLLSGLLDDATEFVLATGEANDKLAAACIEECASIRALQVISSPKWRVRMAAAQHVEDGDVEERVQFLRSIVEGDPNGNVRYAALEELRRIEHASAQAVVAGTHIFDPDVLYGDKPFEFEVRGQRIVANEDGKHAGMVFIPKGDGGDFWMDMFSVSNAQFESVVKKRKYHRYSWSPHDDSPVTMITWEEAVEYAEKVGKRLPKEEEWELAAAGPSRLAFPWGNDPGEDACRAALDIGDGSACVNTVYTNNASDVGCFDMSGNVWEWTADPYDPENPERGHAVRGGAWYNDFASCGCGARDYFWHVISICNIGFRCCQ